MWARFDDGYYGNAKIIAAGHEGRDLHMASVIWVAGNAATTGLIPYRVLPIIGGLADVKPRLHSGTADRLVSLNLWEGYDQANWRLHDFHVYLPKDPTASERQARFRNAPRNGNVTPPVTDRHDDPLSSARNATRTRPDPSLEDLTVFNEWAATIHGLRQFTRSRQRVVVARRKEGYVQHDLLDAVKGWQNDPWPSRAQQNDLTILLRDGGQVEKFRDLWRNGRPPTVIPGRAAEGVRIGQQYEALAQMAESQPQELPA